MVHLLTESAGDVVERLSTAGVVRRREGVAVEWLPAAARDEAVASLDRPWVADEGPLDARFRRLDTIDGAFLPRGLAFDGERTVTWDEDGVQVVAPAPADDGVIALEWGVLVLDRPDFEAPPRLLRVDYLRDGVWIAARYRPDAGAEGGGDA